MGSLVYGSPCLSTNGLRIMRDTFACWKFFRYSFQSTAMQILAAKRDVITTSKVKTLNGSGLTASAESVLHRLNVKRAERTQSVKSPGASVPRMAKPIADHQVHRQGRIVSAIRFQFLLCRLKSEDRTTSYRSRQKSTRSQRRVEVLLSPLLHKLSVADRWDDYKQSYLRGFPYPRVAHILRGIGSVRQRGVLPLS